MTSTAAKLLRAGRRWRAMNRRTSDQPPEPLLRSLRLKLTAWYAGILFCILALIGAGAILVVQHSLAAETDRSLLTFARSQEEPSERLLRGQGFPVSGIPSRDPDTTYLPRGGDTFVLVFNRGGQVVANPRGAVAKGLPVKTGVEAAVAGRTDRRTVELAGQPFRVLTLPLEQGGALQVGRSLTSNQHELQEIEVTLALIGLGGLALAAGGGILMAGRALKPVQESMARQRSFVADASHELRAPLTLIRASAETAARAARRRHDPDTALLDDLIGEVDRLSLLVSDLLLLAQAGEAQVAIMDARTNLQEIVEAAVRRMEPVRGDRQIRLTAPSAPLFVNAPSGRLAQIFLILLDNAVKHTPGGTAIQIEVHRTGRQAEVTITDNGPGLSTAELEHAFDRFFRGDKARTRSGGSGLGLPIAKALSEILGGSIQLSTPASGGLRASLRFPLAPAPPHRRTGFFRRGPERDRH